MKELLFQEFKKEEVRIPWNDSQVEPPLRTGRTLTTHFEKTCKTIHVRLLAIHAGRRFIHDKGRPCLPFFPIAGLRYSPTSHTFPCVCRSLCFFHPLRWISIYEPACAGNRGDSTTSACGERIETPTFKFDWSWRTIARRRNYSSGFQPLESTNHLTFLPPPRSRNTNV